MNIADLVDQFLSGRERYENIISGRARSLPYVRIKSPRPQARRSSINRTATPQEHKINITSGSDKYIPELYGECSPKPHMFAIGMDGNDLIFGLWYGFGEIEEFTEILINEAAVPAAVTVEEHKGTTAQTASTILSNLSGYTHTLVLDVNGTNRGVAYLVFRVPPGAVDGFPKVTVKLKGNCDIEDTRGPTTAYSDLPALCFRHWLTTVGAGPEFSVLDSTFETLADFNEEVPGDAWQATYNYSVGDFATPVGANVKFRIYEVTTDAGSSGAGEPAWDDTLGATTVDDGITWTCRDGRRHVCGMDTGTRADIDSWIETWRTACGCMVHFGESGLEVLPDKTRAKDHTFLHASGEILESPALKTTRLKDRPTVVQVIYTNTSGEPWRDGTDARVARSGVDAGTTPERVCVIKAPWIHRKAQAVRLATELLNGFWLTDLSFQLHVFDEGLKVRAGDVVEVTHPIGLSAKKMRVLDASAMAPGRWVLDLWEYDEAVHSDHVESEPTYPDFGLNTGVVIPKTFISTPTTPYKVGDTWVGGPSGDIKRCSTARTSGAYQSGDWELASNYDNTGTAIENSAASMLYNWNLTIPNVDEMPAGIYPTVSITDFSQVDFLDSSKNSIKILSTPDTIVAYGFPAIPINDKHKYTITIRHKSSVACVDGLYLRVSQYNAALPVGKTHIGSVSGGANTQIQTNYVILEQDAAMPGTSWTVDTYTYTPTAGTKYASFGMYNYNPATAGVEYHVDYVLMYTTDSPLLLNELNCVGGYQEVSLPKEDGSPNCVDCYVNNNSGTAQWFKVAEFDLTGNYKTCTWNGLFNQGSSDGRYTSQMRVRISAQTLTGALGNLGYKYSGDDRTAYLKVAYVGVVVTVYAYLGAYESCFFDGAWSANVAASNSWIHTLQSATDTIGAGTPAGTYLTATKNYTLGADITNDNTADNADNYTGAAITVTYTDADITNDNTADDTDHLNGCINETGVVRIDDELRIYGTDLTFYSAAAYRGKIYCDATYMYLDSPSFILADSIYPATSAKDLGAFLYPWDNIYGTAIYGEALRVTTAAITLGSVGTPFTLHVYDTGSSSWVTYDSYITPS